MNFEKKDIEGIIPKLFASEATPEEIEYIRSWIEEDVENEKLFYQYKNIWDIANPPFSPEDIDTDKAMEKLMSKIGEEKPAKVKLHKSIFYYWQKIAVVITLPLIFICGYLIYSKPAKVEYAYQEVFSPYGSRSFIKLPDSSNVWLNAGSRLKYSVDMKNGERTVELDGEAYFEVKSNKENPFVVRVKNLDVVATGTAFNVEAYDAGQYTAVTLVRGKVDLKVASKEISLTPNQRIEYDHQSDIYKRTTNNLYKWYSWKDGILAFRDDSLEYVFKRIGQTYNIDFIVKDRQLLNYIYHATFENESLDEILHLLELSAPIRYKKIRNTDKSNNEDNKLVIEVYKR